MARVAEVIVTLPVEGRFHYSIPEQLDDKIQIGHRVLIPFGRRRVTGFIRDFHEKETLEAYKGKLKSITEILDPDPILRSDLIDLVRFASDYYLEPEGEILRIALPPGVTAASNRRYRITASGSAAVSSGDLIEEHRELLERASSPRGIRKDKQNAKFIRKLEKLLLIEAIEQFHVQETEKQVEIIQRLEGVEPKKLRRGSKQEALFAALAERPLSRPEINQILGVTPARNTIRGLEKKGLIRTYKKQIDQKAAIIGEDTRQVQLTAEQRKVLTPICSEIDAKVHNAFLLRGVTGSGKTEVYLRAIERVRKQNRTAIVLVPEIALTSQLEARFRERFADDVVVLHSAMTDKQRRDGWAKLFREKAGIALGPRSAVWAPVNNLGLVIVDEEHDSSFKQHSDVRYNGRDLALVRAHRADAVVVLGSATPSLETRRLAKSDRIQELRLAKRFASQPLPSVTTVDLGRCARDAKGEVPLISRQLADALIQTVERKEQAILFLNRRGFNTVLVCDQCGAAKKCASCDVSLTHHKHSKVLVCHYCNATEQYSTKCNECGANAMQPYGAGTQRVAEDVARLVPSANIIRLDRDITSKAGALEKNLDAFRNQSADILIGTQMVAKGHDFPKVTLVGIICADSSLGFPDFRAAEKTFQLITQVAGRAGRGDRPGHVIIQTFQPNHFALECAIDHDDDKFYEIEAASREKTNYPPFSRLGVIRVESLDEKKVEEVSRRLGQLARSLSQQYSTSIRGPVAAPIEKIKGKHRKLMLILAPKPALLVANMRSLQKSLKSVPSSVDVIYDVDAHDLL